MKGYLLISVFFILSLIPALGQTERQLTPLEIKRSSFITQPATLRKGFIRGSFSGYYNFIDKIFDASGKKTYLHPSNIFGVSSGYFAEGSYGINNRLEAGLSLTYRTERINHSAEFMSGSTVIQSTHTVEKGNGFSDVQVYSTFQLLKENTKQRSVLMTVNFTIPAGRKDPEMVSRDEKRRPSSNGDFKTDIAISYRKVSYPFIFTPAASYSMSLGGEKKFSPTGPNQKFKDGSKIILSSLFGVHLNEWIAFRTLVQYYGKITKDKIENKAIDEPVMVQSLDVVPAIVFQVNKLRLTLGITIPVYGKLSGADANYIFRTDYVF